MKKIQFMLLAILVLAVACKSNEKALLTSQEWELKQMEGLTDKPERMPSLQFTDTATIFGFAGCNRFFATYETGKGNKLTIHPGGVTMMYCPDMPVEDRFLLGLKKVAGYSIQNNELQLKDSTGKVQMVFGPLVKGEQVGVAKDEHGCNAAAGYTWSEVQAKCIRLFEDGIQFQSVQDTASALAAYVVFSADSLKAEVFVPDQENHPELDRRELPAGGYAWNQEDDDTYNVRIKDGVWVIEQRGNILYSQSR